MKKNQNNAYYMRLKDLESINTTKKNYNNSNKKLYFHNLNLKGCLNK